MNADSHSLGQRLLAVEPLSPNSRQQLEQELSHMFQRELSKTRRTFFGAVAASALVSGGICGALALTEPDLPTLPRTALAVGSLFGLAWAVVAARICWRGELDLKRDARRIAAMVWTFTVLMMTFFLFAGMNAENRQQGIMMIVGGLPFLIGAGVYWLNFRIEQAELSTQEKFLQLELRLAMISEKS
jgi:hypothetical protein